MAKAHPQADNQTAIRIPYPKGLLRLGLRAPLLFYRLGLGGLLGKRFLLLEHRGRRSGAIRRTVIEVIDLDPQRGSFVVVSAWGTKADWYRNLLAEPAVELAVSTRHFPAVARTVSREEAQIHLRNYATHHPAAFRELGSLLVGEASRDVDATIRRFADTMPIVEFTASGPDRRGRPIGAA
ncbi:MAG TPA: nitroreductase family deazaflavin-dependent oxidoreductase [Anaerolineales bacterium]|nr:nitroreductase family deazaflavin-dependent oxidoreductase [Anaerolineales bacterium]HLE03805.1 nitroreductase family deazaflavin-dependent oxidoreductase [Anaerolineales bacterium]